MGSPSLMTMLPEVTPDEIKIVLLKQEGWRVAACTVNFAIYIGHLKNNYK
jgi:hypothetical protein